MATRSEQFRAEQQRRAHNPKKKRRRAKRRVQDSAYKTHPTKHAARKATYAFEPTPVTARPSRKSTRGSANHAKPDTNLNLREERQKGSPETRFEKARAKRTHVRGRS